MGIQTYKRLGGRFNNRLNQMEESLYSLLMKLTQTLSHKTLRELPKGQTQRCGVFIFNTEHRKPRSSIELVPPNAFYSISEFSERYISTCKVIVYDTRGVICITSFIAASPIVSGKTYVELNDFLYQALDELCVHITGSQS